MFHSVRILMISFNGWDVLYFSSYAVFMFGVAFISFNLLKQRFIIFVAQIGIMENFA